MNDGNLQGWGSGYAGIIRPCLWQLYETSLSLIPFISDAKYFSCLASGAGGGGGSGRLGTATNAGGGGGGASGGLIVVQKIPVSVLKAYGFNSINVTIGAGGNGGATSTTDGVNGNTGTQGGTTELAFTNNARFVDSTSAYSQVRSSALGGPGGSGGGTAASGGGTASTGFPYGYFPGMNGGGGSTTNGNLAINQSNFPSNFCIGAGNGGSGKNNSGGYPLGLNGFSASTASGYTYTNRGINGFDSTFTGTTQFNELLKLPYFPDLFELKSYLHAGGGGGGGGDSTVAGGSGGAGWRGAGGGGGGGGAVTSGGAGGKGGDGFVLICWEY